MPSKLASLVDHAELLLQSKDYSGAATAADAVLSDLASLSRAAVIRGNALLFPLLEQLADKSRDNPSRAEFREAGEMFALALRLDPSNSIASTEAGNLQGILEHHVPDEGAGIAGRLSPAPAPASPTEESFDVVIVGAGASGVGAALMLTRVFKLDSRRVVLLERGAAVGETFRRWPREMRFISPSFNQQGWTASFDLNSVSFGTSPAFVLHTEHPSGEQYAAYLSTLAEAAGLSVRLSTEVVAVRLGRGEEGFMVEVAPSHADAGGAGPAAPTVLRSRFVIWAAGEFQYPTAGPSSSFLGSELCQHNSSVRSWGGLPGDDFIIIGGYESGMDAASNLAARGKRCTVVSSTAYWDVKTEDPSTELAPYTAERMRAACASEVPPLLLAPLRVMAVEEVTDREVGGYLVHAQWGPPAQHSAGLLRASVRGAAPAAALRDRTEGSELTLHTPQPPLLCTGFVGSVAGSAVVRDLFDWGQNDGDGEGGCSHGAPRLTERDESTKTPGLFLVGPSVRHGELVFCFIYKFRQRFAVVAEAIASKLGLSTEEAVEECRKSNMYLDDLEYLTC